MRTSTGVSDRRESERLTVSELLWLRRARLKYGPAVSVIDLSRGGTQIETTSHRLRPGTIVVVQIEGPEGEFAIPARVLRCEIAGLVPSATYRGALVFKQPFELPTAADAGSADGDANLIHEHARLSRALRRFGEAHAADSMNPRLAFTGVGGASLAATLAMIESPSGRRAGEPFTRELSRLFRATTQWIEGGAAPDVLITEISELARKHVNAE
jgi:hypothetical protein